MKSLDAISLLSYFKSFCTFIFCKILQFMLIIHSKKVLKITIFYTKIWKTQLLPMPQAAKQKLLYFEHRLEIYLQKFPEVSNLGMASPESLENRVKIKLKLRKCLSQDSYLVSSDHCYDALAHCSKWEPHISIEICQFIQCCQNSHFEHPLCSGVQCKVCSISYIILHFQLR